MANPVQICSEALILLRDKPISSFTDGTESAEICDELYPSFVRAMLADYPWYFSTKKQQLSKLSASPINEFDHKYLMPSDLLRLIAIYDSDQTGVRPFKNYDLINKEVHSNETSLWAEYAFYVAENKWPSYFRRFFVIALAEHLAMPITGKDKMANYYFKKAYGLPSDNGRGGLFGRATLIDAQQQPPEIIQDPGDLVIHRFS